MQPVLIAGPVLWCLVVHVDEFPEPRPHSIYARSRYETLGGTSAGKALNLSRLDVPVTLATAFGDDDAGRQIAAALDRPGIEVRAVPSRTGSEQHCNLMDGCGRRLSIQLNKADPVEPLAVSDDAIAEAAAVVVDLASYARPILGRARAAGREVWCDLHDYDGVSDYHRDFAGADHIFVSADRLADPEGFLRARVAAGARLAVCTYGADGAVALERGGDLVRVPAEPVDEVVDTNGAGDAFFAGFLAARLRGAGLTECLREAARAGASAVQSRELAGVRDQLD
ncbi:carbohydrate kinase family protein [Paractinoplanes rishiriensis]|uniref:Ribokinase n=1 Tax=Paractinoplanes rishiriensis TaxID=1050105 RepID=A0A919K0W0_9ACTN|nr:PfkB family carbohydrate kinase [Actinoplanes rishiriensis]GIE96603.1 ribokinase [Actinoplanes rishiriensis]